MKKRLKRPPPAGWRPGRSGQNPASASRQPKWAHPRGDSGTIRPFVARPLEPPLPPAQNRNVPRPPSPSAAQSGRATPESPPIPAATVATPLSLHPPHPFRLSHPAAASPTQPIWLPRPGVSLPPQPEWANPTGASFPGEPIWVRRARDTFPAFPHSICRSQPPESPPLPPTRHPRAAKAARPQDSHGPGGASYQSSRPLSED